MAFWGDSGFDNQDNTEPKRAYRWLMRINSIEEWIVKKVTKPGFDITETSHQFLNHTFYYPGRVEWQTIDVTLVDPVAPDTTALLSTMVERSGYHVPNQADPGQWVTLSKNSGVSSIGKIQIEQINAKGQEVESWTLVNPWIKSLKFGDLDYSSDDMVEITMTLRYDWAKLNTSAGGRVFYKPTAADLGSEVYSIPAADAPVAPGVTDLA